jgi:hypothetical protein
MPLYIVSLKLNKLKINIVIFVECMNYKIYNYNLFINMTLIFLCLFEAREGDLINLI